MKPSLALLSIGLIFCQSSFSQDENAKDRDVNVVGGVVNGVEVDVDFQVVEGIQNQLLDEGLKDKIAEKKRLIEQASKPQQIQDSKGEKFNYLFTVNDDKLVFDPNFISADASAVKFGSPILKNPTNWDLSSLDRIEFSREILNSSSSNVRLSMSNGDVLSGNLVSVEGDALILDPGWKTQQIKIRRQMIQNMESFDNSNLVFAGPHVEGVWKFNPKKAARDGILLGDKIILGNNGTVCHELPKMKGWHISFSMKYPTSYYGFSLALFSEFKEDQPTTGGYTFHINAYNTRLSKKQGNQHAGFIPSTESINPSPDFFRKFINQKVRVDIYGDRESGVFAYYFNGKRMGLWRDANIANNKLEGNVLELSLMTGGYRNGGEVSDFKVYNWKGILPANVVDSLDQEDKKYIGKDVKDMILLANGDKLFGKILGVEEGKIQFQTNNYSINIPLSRTTNLKALGAQERQRKMKGDVTCKLHSGDSVTFQLKEWKNGQLKGFSESLGEIVLPQNKISTILFNLYNSDLKKQRSK